MELNARLLSRTDISPDLAIFRIGPDGPLFPFESGQFAVIALPTKAPRVDLSGEDEKPMEPEKLIRRAYSIASSSKRGEFLEFFVKLVRSGALTPRLFALPVNGHLWLGPKAAGQFTLSSVAPGKNLVMVATGTGLAPYVSMIRTAYRCGEGPGFTVVHGARNSWDLGYRGEMEALAAGCRNFVYVPTLSRPEKREGWAGHVGRVRTVFEDGTVTVDRAKDDVFLCGAPEMVEEMQAMFEGRGYVQRKIGTEGNLHIERYW